MAEAEENPFISEVQTCVVQESTVVQTFVPDFDYTVINILINYMKPKYRSYCGIKKIFKKLSFNKVKGHGKKSINLFFLYKVE